MHQISFDLRQIFHINSDDGFSRGKSGERFNRHCMWYIKCMNIKKYLLEREAINRLVVQYIILCVCVYVVYFLKNIYVAENRDGDVISKRI